MIQIGELQRVAQEEDGGVVSYQIPVAFVCIELDGKSADIAFGIGSSTLSGYGREAYKNFRLFADL